MSDNHAARHFDSISDAYGKSSYLHPLYRAVAPELNDAVAGRSVLDVGNGGVFPYDIGHARDVTVLDISPEMLSRVTAPQVTKVVGDARDMMALPDARFDVVLFNLSLHHIAADTLQETEDGVHRALQASFRTLRPGGELILYEPLLNPLFHALYRAAFHVFRIALKMAGSPMVQFHSERFLRHHMTQIFNVAPGDVRVSAPRIDGWVDPIGGVRPGVIRIPIQIFPTRFHLLRVKKRG